MIEFALRYHAERKRLCVIGRRGLESSLRVLLPGADQQLWWGRYFASVFSNQAFSDNNSEAELWSRGIPFTGESSKAGGLLQTHSHPLRQTLINLCVHVWISQLNLWHAALPEHRLYKCPLPTDKSRTKTRLAACHCLAARLIGKGVQKAIEWGPESSTRGLRLEAKGQLVVRL